MSTTCTPETRENAQICVVASFFFRMARGLFMLKPRSPFLTLARTGQRWWHRKSTAPLQHLPSNLVSPRPDLNVPLTCFVHRMILLQALHNP